MQPKEIPAIIDYPLQWDALVEISKMRADLDSIEAMGATHVNIETKTYGDGEFVEIEILAIQKRLQTQDEYEAQLRFLEKIAKKIDAALNNV